MADHLTHVDARGAARMVDVAAKAVTTRTATASGLLRTSAAVVELLRGAGVPKGDALAVARVAAIAGAKRTPDLIPLCHPIAVHGVEVDLTVVDAGVSIRVTVRTADRTGVEMEALTAVSVAGLTLIDMVKAVDKAACLTDIQVDTKSGGRSGDYRRADPAGDPVATAPETPVRAHHPGAPAAVSPAEAPAEAHRPGAPAAVSPAGAPTAAPPTDQQLTVPVEASVVPVATRAAVITCSNRSARGERADDSGRILADGLTSWGCTVTGPRVVPDDVAAISDAIRAALTDGAALIVTTGGTGVTPTDVTPEATAPLLDRQIPGVAETLRSAARDRVPTSVLSRGLVGLAGRCLVVNLPGSPGGVRDGLAALRPLVGHIVDQAHGGDHPYRESS